MIFSSSFLFTLTFSILSILHNVIPIGLYRCGDLVAYKPTFLPPSAGGEILLLIRLGFDDLVFKWKMNMIQICEYSSNPITEDASDESPIFSSSIYPRALGANKP